MARILVADDDAVQVEMQQKLLETFGHQVATATSPEEALHQLDRERPHLAIVDLRMPLVSDGVELIRGIRQKDSAVPIIVLSGWPDDLYGSDEEALVTRVVMKGSIRDLLQTIAELLPS